MTASERRPFSETLSLLTRRGSSLGLLLNNGLMLHGYAVCPTSCGFRLSCHPRLAQDFRGDLGVGPQVDGIEIAARRAGLLRGALLEALGPPN